MLAVAVAALMLTKAVRQGLVVLVVAVLEVLAHLVLVEQEQQTQVVAVAVVYTIQGLELLAAMVVLVSWLFVTQILLLMPHLLQVHPHLLTLVDTRFTSGQDQGVSHSDGTFCTT
jgi:hypothetical protein